ncbi:aminotransferase class V-fold PLP-dependent enzyme [Sphingosinicella sp. CPCC 101087]|uniref:aminotransferase class V-fold PLP-dependent enzyme n=1 Tax=Sphingosinicella sp. CPCC 101087 TaxID=2497754 RepID=UPI00101B7CC8|nr:aminotransferase class V-fold PLP-dependent enzyme [Sphingosinicella sp. CPCC 101087]
MSSLESACEQSSIQIDGLQDARRRFPTLERLAYINSGSYGLLGDTVRASLEEYMDHRVKVGADWDLWVDRAGRVRDKVARLLGAQRDEIAVTASASAGINALASALDFSGGRDRILVSNYEFPTSGQIWHAQARRGAVVEHVAEDESGLIPPEHFADRIDERTRIVVLSHVCYRHGGKFSNGSIRSIVEVAHDHGAYVILDCFQSAGAEVIDVKELGVDFAVGGMFKYLLGTAGIGFLYVRRELIPDLVPTASGWFAQDDIGAMNIFANDPSHTASRFEAGTPPVPSCYAADAGLGIILEYGIEAIAARISALTRYALDRFIAEGFPVATPVEDSSRGPMLTLEARDAVALVTRLIERNVVTSYRDGNVRAGFHLYNDRSDVDRLIEALRANRELLA